MTARLKTAAGILLILAALALWCSLDSPSGETERAYHNAYEGELR